MSSNTFPSLPLIDPETLEFEINVDGLVSSGGLGGPAILPMSLAKMAQMTQAFPDKSFSGIGGVSDFSQALSLLPARLRHGAGVHGGDARPGGRTERDQAAERRASTSSSRSTPTRAGSAVEDFRGSGAIAIVLQSQIRRPEAADYHGGYEPVEGYAAPRRERSSAGDCAR